MINGFTKEELKDILSWGEAYTEFGQSWVTKLQEPLLNKIQSMIEIYCDHLTSNPNSLTLRDINQGIYAFFSVCDKCGEYYE